MHGSPFLPVVIEFESRNGQMLRHC